MNSDRVTVADCGITFIAEFIRLYLTRNNRWLSPKFLAGESYGTTRAAALTGGGSGVADVELVREDADSDGRVLVRGARVVLLPRGRAEARATLTPPSAPSGPYSVYFRLTHNGVGFGERLWASVEVA